MRQQSQQKSGKTAGEKRKRHRNIPYCMERFIILCVLAVCIFLMISCFGLGGIAGEICSSVIFGLFGWVGYVIPILIFGVVAFLITQIKAIHTHT